jgi:CDP-L-myo-inositol myo-inositolphosphotransferase
MSKPPGGSKSFSRMETPERSLCILLASAAPGAAHRTAVFALRLVERTVLAFRRAGVREFVVTGDPEEVEWVCAALRGGRCSGVRVRAAESLVAALAGREYAFLARADTHYDRRLIARFVEETRAEAAARVAVDFRPDARAAHEGAPRVSLWPGGESLRLVGEGLVGADGVSTGLALVTPGFARAFAEAPPGERRLTAALNLLAQREPVATFPVAELWQDVRDEGGLVRARRKVLAGAVGVADGIVARHLNRPLSRRITERLLSRDVKPWQISIASFLGTLASGLSFATGHALTGGLLAQSASVLDGVDGELARIRYQDSPFGGVYDALLDRVGDAAVIGGMTLYAWAMGSGQSAIALGFAAVAGSSLSMLVKEKYGTQYRRRYADERERARWLLLGRDGRLFLAMVAGLTGYVEAVLAYMAVGTHLHAGVRVYRIRAEAASA